MKPTCSNCGVFLTHEEITEAIYFAVVIAEYEGSPALGTCNKCMDFNYAINNALDQGPSHPKYDWTE